MLLAALIGLYATAIALAPASLAFALAAPMAIAPLTWWTVAAPQRWLPLFFAAAILLPPLPFALGDSGPHPALLIAALGGLTGLARLRQWRFQLDGVALALLTFFAVLLASVGLAAVYSGPAIAAASLARVMLFGIGCYVYFYVTQGPDADPETPMRYARLLFAMATLAALFAGVDFYFQFPAPAGYGPQFVWLDAGVFRRAQGLFYEASTLGNFCAFFLVMIAVALFRPRGERPCSRILLLTGGVVFSAALVFSYSRASLLNVLVSLAALAYLRGVRMKRVAAASALCLVAAAALVYAVFPSFAESYWIRLSASVQYFWSSPEGVLSGRVASWQKLIAFLMEHPWHAVFGIGYKTLPYSDFVGGTVIADNMYLSLLVETGVAGLAAFGALNYSILRQSLAAYRRGSPTGTFFGAWIFCFWVGQVFQMASGDLMTYWRVLPLYFWALGVAVRER